jgi:hypothetical protein
MGFVYNWDMKTTEERFFEKVNKTDTCWLWTGSNNGVGYGEIRINNKKVYAHRWSYEHFKGKIPEGMHIDHLCRTPSCVNPDHLEIVTPKENVRRGDVPGHHPERKKEYCANGHLYSDNTYNRKDGKGRNCTQCVRDRAREYMRRKSGYYERHPQQD